MWRHMELPHQPANAATVHMLQQHCRATSEAAPSLHERTQRALRRNIMAGPLFRDKCFATGRASKALGGMGKHRAASALVHRSDVLRLRPNSPLHRTQTRAQPSRLSLPSISSSLHLALPRPSAPMALWYALNDPVLSQLERTLDCMLQE